MNYKKYNMDNTTIIIATYNRAYTLKQVVNSFYNQKYVNEIIFVDDCSTDDTEEFLSSLMDIYPNICTKCIKHNVRRGQVHSRISGYLQATNDYILFCDDDEFLEENYVEVCYKILVSNDSYGAVSGRRVYRYGYSELKDSIQYFYNNLKSKEYFDFSKFCFNYDAQTTDLMEVPLTNSIILTRKELLVKLNLDTKYSRGNGYREESDYQANLIKNGYKIILTNKAHSIHLDLNEVKKGGQRMNRIKRLYWNTYFSNYFIDKYYRVYKTKYPDKVPNSIMLLKLKMSYSQMLDLFFIPIKKRIFK